MKHVNRMDNNDLVAFQGAPEFPGGGRPLTWEGLVWIEGARRWVKLAGGLTQVEFHYDVDGDPRCLASSTNSYPWYESEIDALVGLVKELGSLDVLLKLGFEDLLD